MDFDLAERCSTCTANLPICGGQRWPALCNPLNAGGGPGDLDAVRRFLQVRGVTLSSLLADWSGETTGSIDPAGPAPAIGPAVPPPTREEPPVDTP